MTIDSAMLSKVLRRNSVARDTPEEKLWTEVICAAIHELYTGGFWLSDLWTHPRFFTDWEWFSEVCEMAGLNPEAVVTLTREIVTSQEHAKAS